MPSTSQVVEAGGAVVQSLGTKPCPRPKWSDLPQFDRNSIPAVMFGVDCRPGTATASGCAAKDAYYTINVPWSQITAEGHEAPGGNFYWSAEFPVTTLADPRAAPLLKQMLIKSKQLFTMRYVDKVYIKNANPRFPDVQIKNPWLRVSMRDVLSKEKGKVATEYGGLRVNILPDPNETLEKFVNRGGVLLMVEDKGPFRGGPIDSYGRPSWAPDWVDRIELWTSYYVDRKVIGFTFRIVQKSAINKAINTVGDWIKDKAAWVCNKVEDPRAQLAAQGAALVPMTAPYAGGAIAAAKICGLRHIDLSCVPQPFESFDPGTAFPPQSTAGATILIPMPAPSPKQTTIVPGAITPSAVSLQTSDTYPAASIAWLDPFAKAYRVAIPHPGETTHQMVLGVFLPQAPTGVRVVNRSEWERATLPWYRRQSTKYGLLVSGLTITLGLVLIGDRRV